MYLVGEEAEATPEATVELAASLNGGAVAPPALVPSRVADVVVAPVAPAELVEMRQVEAVPAMTAGVVAGRTLSEAPFMPLPALVAIAIDSDPAGASVSEGLEILGQTPLRVEVTKAKHVFTLARVGFVPAIVEVDAASADGTEPIARKLVLAPDHRVPTARPSLKPRVPPRPLLREPLVLVQPVPDPPPARRNPQVKLLLDQPAEPGTDPSKKPAVKLLDEDEDTPPKPRVKVLE